MTPSDISASLRRLGIRVAPETAQYVARHIQANAQSDIPVLGGDARTGVPIRKIIRPHDLAAPSGAAPWPTP